MTRRLTRFVIAAATLALFAGGVPATALQADPFAGTWTLNVAKSKYDPGPAPKSGAVTFSTSGKSVKAIVAGVTDTGEKMQWEYTAAADGKDYPITGNNPNGDTVVLKQLSPNSFETTMKLKGKVTVVNVRTVAADGKTLTVTTKGMNPQGQKVNDALVFEKK